MGVIDRATHTIACECGNKEFVTFLQHGSAYGASWQVEKELSKFKVSWGKAGGAEPAISSAICKVCGKVPSIIIS